MTSKEAFVQTWAMETATTRRVLTAVPEKNHDYRPDPKSRGALDLAAFVAGHSYVLAEILEKGELKAGPMPAPKNSKEAAGMFDAGLPRVEKLFASISEKNWDTQVGRIFGPDGKMLQEAPIGALAWFTLFDLIHHRGQLSAYLRPMGGKVPSIYGPSGDDPGKN
jgi:uncharacterized damage-inducible protein DinB